MDTSAFAITGRTIPQQQPTQGVQAVQPTKVTQPTLSPIQVEGQSLDPSVVALMHGLKQNESPNGDYNAIGDQGTAAGIGQWSNQPKGKPVPLQPGQIPSNFQNMAKQFGYNPTDFSPENQNKVLYAQLAKDKADGLTPEQALSKWNSGDPNKYLNAATSTGTGPVGAYNVASYVQKGMTAAQQYAQQQKSQTSQPILSSNGMQEAPSIGGFLGNVVKSGANLVGGIGEAVLHPIQTVQNIGGAAVGGLQELGGQQNENTAKFDALKNYFVQKYGGVQNIEHSIYTDPVGVLADLSAVFGVGAGVAGVAGKVGELAGIAGAAERTAGVVSALGKASELTNPLTPVIKGGGALLSKGSGVGKNLASQFTEISPQGMQDIYNHPESYTPEAMANTTRLNVAQQVESALAEKENALSEAGGGYDAIKRAGDVPAGYENIKNVPPPNAIPVASNFLEEQFRKVGNLEIKDGTITPTTLSKLGKSGLSKFQDILDTYKPAFQRGYLTPEEFLTLRQRLDEAAFTDAGIKNSTAGKLAAGLRTSLNENYRTAVPGLEELDKNYSSQLEELKTLRKGFIDKDGNLTQSAISKIANAGNKDLDLERLEKIVPGITRQLTALKVIKEIEGAAGIKVGAYTKSITEAGGVVAGISTGNMAMLAGALSMAALTSPKFIVPLLRFLGENKELIPQVLANLAKYATMSSVANQATNGTSQPTEQIPAGTTPSDQSPAPSEQQTETSVSPDLISLAKSKDFDLDKAIEAGYTPQEVQDFLNTQK
jgi:hypothetical protein